MNFSNNTSPLIVIAKNSVRLLAILLLFSCSSKAQTERSSMLTETEPSSAVSDAQSEPLEALEVYPGAYNLSGYIDELKAKKVAVVANQTSYIGERHLVDTLLSLGVDIAHVYAPEHGFRGEQGAGDHVDDELDAKTGLPIYSLHGKTKKPSASSLKGIDVVVFDIQDVGLRFYTYISTLHYVMEACAEQAVAVIVLDRPNPNLVSKPDGPVMEPAYESFIGMHPVPVLYGLSIGEYGQMINGEQWLKGELEADLKVVPCLNYSRSDDYTLPIAPSPNLPNSQSIDLYASLCLFEGTVVSIGRGTEYPFQIIGHPQYSQGDFIFIPESTAAAKYPKLEGEQCQGYHLTEAQATEMAQAGRLDLSYLIDFYQDLGLGDAYFRKDGFFNLLAGTDELRQQIQAGKTELEIRATWAEGLQAYEVMYRKYWIYK